jgi:GNAT superfamily N-acetyltransferase
VYVVAWLGTVHPFVDLILGMTTDAAFSIRPARLDDAKAFRMLLPDNFNALDFRLVVEAGSPTCIVAAAGLTTAERPKPLVGPGVALHVIKPYRQHGIGKQLISRLISEASGRGASALYATQKVDLLGEKARGWTWLGFSPCDTVEHHELPLDQFEPRLAPLYERMRKQGRIPESAQIIPLYEADFDAVTQLHLAVLGGDAPTLLRRMRGEGPDAFSAQYSRVLLLDGRVAGFILGHRTSREVIHVDANVLDPQLRGGWANIWLKLEATRGALSIGVQTFVFTTFDHYADTRSFTEKLQGSTVRTMVLMYRPIATF